MCQTLDMRQVNPCQTGFSGLQSDHDSYLGERPLKKRTGIRAQNLRYRSHQSGSQILQPPEIGERMEGCAVVRQYEQSCRIISLGDEPPHLLRAFDRLYIEPGESTTFEAQLLRRDVSIWDPGRQDWEMVKGFTVFVGSLSRKLPLSAEVSL